MLNIILLIAGIIATYTGRVVDEKGEPIPYATVYPQEKPEVGTATNNDGYFQFQTDLPGTSEVLFSFIGYEKVSLPLATFAAQDASTATVVLKEQPIALQETVVATKAKKQRNKRKKMATLLHAVYVKLEQECRAYRTACGISKLSSVDN